MEGNVVKQPSTVNKTTNTKLGRVELKSRENPNEIFTNLGHILSLEFLTECFNRIDGNKAVGIDEITKEEYGKNLGSNLKILLSKIRDGSYYPKPTRTVEISKHDGTKRPLAISCLEDKIVQGAVCKILECIFEPHFLSCSHGFRPNESCHKALVDLDKNLMKAQTGAIVDVDIKKCFPSIPHENLIEILTNKIADKRFLYLIIKLIKCDSLDALNNVVRNDRGLPQGSILSPLLMNIYLHECVDKWFMEINVKEFEGGCTIVRYADDMVFTAKSVADAEQLRLKLGERLGEYGLELHETKTKVMPNGRKVVENLIKLGQRPPVFAFLGFIHVWGKSLNRSTNKIFWRVKRRTCPVRFKSKLSQILENFKKNRHRKDFFDYAKRIVNGYLEYFAINDNMKRISQFVHEVKSMMFKWLNRRSQKPSFNWKRFAEILDKVKFPKPYIRHNLFFNSSAFKQYR